MEKTYSIAGLKVRVTGQQTARNIASLPGFSVFEYTDPRDADIIINTDRHILTGLPSGIRLLNSYRVMEIDHYFWSFDGGYLFEMKRDGAHVVTMLHKSHTNEVSMSSCNCEISLKFATWVAYSFVAVKMGVIPVHSSAIVNNSHAVLFLGESGTGNSTNTRLWIK